MRSTLHLPTIFYATYGLRYRIRPIYLCAFPTSRNLRFLSFFFFLFFLSRQAKTKVTEAGRGSLRITVIQEKFLKISDFSIEGAVNHPLEPISYKIVFQRSIGLTIILQIDSYSNISTNKRIIDEARTPVYYPVLSLGSRFYGNKACLLLQSRGIIEYSAFNYRASLAVCISWKGKDGSELVELLFLRPSRRSEILILLNVARAHSNV